MSATDLTDADFAARVLQADKPVLVDLWAEWCGPCRKVGPIVDEIAVEHDELDVYKINIDEQPQVSRDYGVMSIPTLLLFKDGELVNRIVGAKPKAALLAEVTPHL
ncbi:MAG TPA: thioredoxin [Nitriliruptoraceae bacterium]|nr:thioredoxin [Nitriliruptoraceae bacterium]